MKKIITYPIYFMVMLLLALQPAKAQTLHQLSGIVADSATKKPLDYITVNLKTDKNVPVKAMLTKENGSFVFSAIKPLKYTITLSAMGYQTKTIAVTDSAQTTSRLGIILLSALTTKLKEVAITADKPIIKQEIDRISYDLQADPDSKGSSVLDMLRKVPFITLDADDNILLKGNSSYKIFINGKPSGMIERDPKNILRSIPASTIQRIEVITTPPAKYDAEGLAGIINIITNKKIDSGYNGSANLNNRLPGGPGAGTSFTFKEGKFGISTFGGGSTYNGPETSNSSTRLTDGTSPTRLEQTGNGSSNRRNGYVGTEMSYEIDSLQLISAQLNFSADRSNGNSALNSMLDGQGGILQAYALHNYNYGNGNGLDASLNYQLGFKKSKTRLLTFSYRYSENTNHNAADLSSTGQINYFTPDYDQENNNSSHEQTIQADYVQGSKKWLMEAGAKGIFRYYQSNSQYNSLDSATHLFEPDLGLSNKYTGDQTIIAGYNSWQYSDKKWGVKAGLRAEQTFTDGNFISTATNVHQNYLDIFPSLSANLNLNNTNGFNLGFTQRVKRPGISKLNPFVDRSNPNFVSSGNPDLKRVLINDIQLSYHINKKASFNIAVTYDYAGGIDLPVSTIDTATKITYTTTENSGSARAIGSNIFLNWPITKRWNLNLNGNAMYFWIGGYSDGVLQTIQLLTESVSATTGYTFNNGWRVSSGFTYRGPNPTGFQGRSNNYTDCSLGINKQIIKNKVNFSATVQNPFTKYRYNSTETQGVGFSQTMVNQSYFRSFNFSLNYNFGKLKEGVKKTKIRINNDDK